MQTVYKQLYTHSTNGANVFVIECCCRGHKHSSEFVWICFQSQLVSWALLIFGRTCSMVLYEDIWVQPSPTHPIQDVIFHQEHSFPIIKLILSMESQNCKKWSDVWLPVA